MPFSVKERKFREVYNNFYPLIFKKIYSRLGSREDSEDICHEIFASLYHKFEEVNDFRKWLLGAIRFEISNYYRKKGASYKDKLNVEDFENDLNLSFENGARDIRIILNEAIESEENYIDEKERILFDLIALKNFTHEQAGRQLGFTKRQVKYKYKLIVNRIIKYLYDKGIKDIDDLL